MLNQFILLAERNPFRDMASVVRDRREHFDPMDLLPWLFVLGALCGALAFVSRYLNRQDKRRLYNNPRALFRALCRAHEMDRSDCRLLLQIAKANEIEQPAALFLDPEILAAARSMPEFRRHHTAIEALSTKLFANDPPLTVLPAATDAPAQTQPIPIGASRHLATRTTAAVAPNKLPPDQPRREPEPEVANEGSDEESLGPGPSLAEQHAVRALETLMKQINASRETSSTASAGEPAGAGWPLPANAAPRPLPIVDVAVPFGDQFTAR